MLKFPSEAPKRKVIRTLNKLGFEIVREKEHISMLRIDSDGKKTPLTIPNHNIINGALLRLICTQAGISRDEFLEHFENS